MIVKKILEKGDMLFLLIISFFTRFFNLGFPPRVVFDEAHFGLYATKYFSHQYYFDIHPPLGKLILALSGFLGSIAPGFNFIEDAFYGNFNFLALRFLPAFFGALLVLLVFLVVLEFGFSRRSAFLAGFLVLFENAILVQSRFILLDSILVFFVFLSLYFFLRLERCKSFSRKWFLAIFFSAVSLGIAISIKWIGLGMMGMLIFLIIKNNSLVKNKKEQYFKIIFIILVAFIVYFLSFFIHFSLLTKECYVDCGSMIDLWSTGSASFLRSIPSGNFLDKFLEVNKSMLFSNFDTRLAHIYASDWYGWPFLIRPVLYFQEITNGNIYSIYFLGNPIIWWFAIVSLIAYFYLIIKNFIFKFKLKLPEIFYSDSLAMVIIGYFIFFLPFLAVPRILFIYHYLIALIFNIILFAVIFDSMIQKLSNSIPDNKIFFSSRKANMLFFGFLALVFISFLYFLPLTYGFPLTESELQSRLWLSSWKF